MMREKEIISKIIADRGCMIGIYLQDFPISLLPLHMHDYLDVIAIISLERPFHTIDDIDKA